MCIQMLKIATAIDERNRMVDNCAPAHELRLIRRCQDQLPHARCQGKNMVGLSVLRLSPMHSLQLHMLTAVEASSARSRAKRLT